MGKVISTSLVKIDSKPSGRPWMPLRNGTKTVGRKLQRDLSSPDRLRAIDAPPAVAFGWTFIVFDLVIEGCEHASGMIC